jgi:single-strand DNA-binding protein
MSSLNKATLIGNLGADPEVRTLNSGDRVANLRIATSETWKDKSTGERKERSEWHQVVVFNEPLVRLCENYLRKGSKIYLEGQLQTRKWTDANGVEKYSTEIVLRPFNGQIVMLDRRGDTQAESADNARQQDAADDSEVPW